MPLNFFGDPRRGSERTFGRVCCRARLRTMAGVPLSARHAVLAHGLDRPDGRAGFGRAAVSNPNSSKASAADRPQLCRPGCRRTHRCQSPARKPQVQARLKS